MERSYQPLLLALLLVASAHAAAGPMMNVDQKVAGMTQAEWTRAWWQWAASFDGDESPVADTSGEHCAAGQHGPVWFLAGTYGTRRTIRTCKVPTGRYLFFPLINYVVMRPASRVVSCDAVTEEAHDMTEGASNLVLRVDGQSIATLEAHRISSDGCFDIGLRRSPVVHIFPAAANGYYVMLKPLKPGRHMVEFGGVLPSMIQAVSYTIDVQ